MNLTEYSEALAAAVERAGKSTVSVDARGRVPATGVVWSAAGEILTADHVVQRDEDLGVVLPDGQRVSAKLVGRDPHSDLALLKVDGATLTTPEFSAAYRVGHVAIALGRPDDLQASVSHIVSIGGPVRGGHRYLEAYIQTDVTMFPGFSGGPLVDAAGRVVGVNSSALARGASLAVPVAAADRVVAALRKYGRVQRGYLGISTQPVALAEAVAGQVGQSSGLMIITVEADGPAASSGILQGDVLVGLGGQSVKDIDGLQGALGPDTVGQTVVAKLVRGGQVQEIGVTVAARP
jgi:S1-C subfamily serine protease